MKIRTSFVSNSSSSSFIVVGTEPMCASAELSAFSAKKICKRMKITPGPDDGVYLTCYIDEEINVKEMIGSTGIIKVYDEGDHGEPYSTRDMRELTGCDDEYDRVWLYTEDIENVAGHWKNY